MYEEILPNGVHDFHRPEIIIHFHKNEKGHVVETNVRNGWRDVATVGVDSLCNVRFVGTNFSEFDGLEASARIFQVLHNVTNVKSFLFYSCIISDFITNVIKMVDLYSDSVEFKECTFNQDGVWHVLDDLMNCKEIRHVHFVNCCFGELLNNDESQYIIDRIGAATQGLNCWHSFAIYAESKLMEEHELRGRMVKSTRRIVNLLSPVLIKHSFAQSSGSSKSCFKTILMQGSNQLLERLITPPTDEPHFHPVDVLHIWGMSVEIPQLYEPQLWDASRGMRITPYHVGLHDVSFRGFQDFDALVRMLHFLGTRKLTLDLIHFDGKNENYFAEHRDDLQLSGRRLPIRNVVFGRTTKCMVEILRGVVENQQLQQLNVKNGPAYASYDENKGATYDEMLGSLPDDDDFAGRELCPVDTTHRCIQALLLRGLVRVPSLVLSEPFEGKQYDRLRRDRYYLPYVDSQPTPVGNVQGNEIQQITAIVTTYHDAYYLMCCLRHTSTLTRVVVFMDKCKTLYKDRREKLMQVVAVRTKCVPIGTAGLIIDSNLEVETWALLYDIVKNNFALSQVLIYNDEYNSVEMKGYRESIVDLLRRNSTMTDGRVSYI